MTNPEQRIRDLQRVQMIEALLQEYEFHPGDNRTVIFKHTTEDILNKVIQLYPEEMEKRIAKGKTPTVAREMILVEIQKRAKRMQQAGITAGYKPRDVHGWRKEISADAVAEWFRNIKNVEMFSKQQLKEIHQTIHQCL